GTVEHGPPHPRDAREQPQCLAWCPGLGDTHEVDNLLLQLHRTNVLLTTDSAPQPIHNHLPAVGRPVGAKGTPGSRIPRTGRATVPTVGNLPRPRTRTRPVRLPPGAARSLSISYAM